MQRRVSNIVFFLVLSASACTSLSAMARVSVKTPIHGSVIVPVSKFELSGAGAYYLYGTISSSPVEVLLKFKYAGITCTGNYKVIGMPRAPRIALTCSNGQQGTATETHDPCDKRTTFDGGIIQISGGITGSFEFGPPLYGCDVRVN